MYTNLDSASPDEYEDWLDFVDVSDNYVSSAHFGDEDRTTDYDYHDTFDMELVKVSSSKVHAPYSVVKPGIASKSCARRFLCIFYTKICDLF